MTYEELLAKVNVNALIKPNALRAIVELHKPYRTVEGNQFCTTCTRTEEEWEFPCPTIQAIEKALDA